jgi:hypothetical protein
MLMVLQQPACMLLLKQPSTSPSLPAGTGEVRVYNEQHLVSLHTVPAPVMALHYGQYGREGTTLIAVLKSGALDIRMLPRTAQLEAGAAGSGPQPEQDVPLQVCTASAACQLPPVQRS